MTMVSSGEVTLGTLPAPKLVETMAFGMSEIRLFATALPNVTSEVVSLRYSHGALGREQLRALATGLDLALHIMDIWFERYEADGCKVLAEGKEIARAAVELLPSV
jgi:hypothetical protein